MYVVFQRKSTNSSLFVIFFLLFFVLTIRVMQAQPHQQCETHHNTKLNIVRFVIHTALLLPFIYTFFSIYTAEPYFSCCWARCIFGFGIFRLLLATLHLFNSFPLIFCCCSFASRAPNEIQSNFQICTTRQLDTMGIFFSSLICRSAAQPET